VKAPPLGSRRPPLVVALVPRRPVLARASIVALGLAVGGCGAFGCSKTVPPVGVAASASTPAPAPAASVSSAPGAELVPASASAAPAASASGSPAAASPPSLPAEGASGPCPADMVLVEGSFCPDVVQTCDKKRLPWQCAEFARPTVCKGTEERRRYCIDRYEFPNEKGVKPVVMQSWYDAQRECKARHKRMCTDSEWTLACEGPERLPFPYGYVRDDKACAIDKPSPKVNEKRLFSKKHGAEEVARLDQREASGERPGCVSPFGVHDLTGNVDEWVINESGHPYKSSLKGGNWGEYRNACRPATRGHAEGFRYYQMGFRCCGDVPE
jgi:formylglycine-generating enzyme